MPSSSVRAGLRALCPLPSQPFPLQKS
jgi:hypothetical protein